MSQTYLCPKCRVVLNPNIRVVLVARFDGVAGVVLMSPKLGDYKLHCDKGFCRKVTKGDLVEFICPVCQKSLTSAVADHFAELLLADPDDPDRAPAIIRFSRVSEEHATFLYDGATVKAFGEDAKHFHGPMIVEGNWGW